ncbi:hypothetical protein CTAYLR_004529 [Chrysophaeum taylorii]|uniref:Katanin p80 subunit C-terminal domain-containing protein n=1 Tax=Chrysophaeum taylorii TaxID=2483200 RepID=A0AAD7XN26_9STRA|nr:hypothetical protein CTAYLR_004529 [Chrysophaeum taylorii]
MGGRKVQEWVAHPSAVTCVCVGRSLEIVASGGEDKRVNVWRLAQGGSTNVWSLGGHSSALSCVALDEGEAVLVAGSMGGGVRLYDVGAGRGVRALSGHMARVSDVACHPFGDFVASGGADAQVKVWDVRRKSCIQSYKGAGDVVRFSPDGRWIASCGGESTIRLWDLTAGKLLRALPVARERPQVSSTHLEFSPREFVLACAGSDRVVRLYDLEVFGPPIASTPAADVVRGLAFSTGGGSIVAAGDSGLRQWSRWDSPAPRLLYDAVSWDQLRLIAVDGDRCVALCSASNFVGVWECAVERDDDDSDDETAQEKKPNYSESLSRTQEPKQREDDGPKRTQRGRDDDDSKLDDTAGLLTEVLLGRSTCRTLEARLEVLRAAAKLWAGGDHSKALRRVHHHAAESGGEDLAALDKWAVAVDFLSAVGTDPATLDAAVDLLSLLADLFADFAAPRKLLPEDDDDLAARHLSLALDAVTKALDLYGDVVQATLSSAVNGVDIAGDDRRAKCEAAHDKFLAISAALPSIRHRAVPRNFTLMNPARLLDQSARQEFPEVEPGLAGEPPGSFPSKIRRVHVGARFEQKLRNLEIVRVPAREMKRRVAVRVGEPYRLATPRVLEEQPAERPCLDKIRASAPLSSSTRNRAHRPCNVAARTAVCVMGAVSTCAPRSSSKRTTSSLSATIALVSAVKPSESAAFGSAPPSRSAAMSFSLPFSSINRSNSI